MKRLVVVRHAKAEKTQFGQTDFDRELTNQGKIDARQVASRLQSENVLPELIISSPSSRAYQTAKILGDVFGIDKKQIVRKILLYDDIETKKVIALLKEEAKHVDTLFLVGHNPVLQRMIHELTDDFHGHLCTSGVVVMDFKVERWSQILRTKGELVLFETPLTENSDNEMNPGL
ncbi:MAG: histidine phosphatase family protein [Bacteroidota bacterium]|nr:histidine phosphatase family protein [Bacteroidota bacterium]